MPLPGALCDDCCEQQRTPCFNSQVAVILLARPWPPALFVVTGQRCVLGLCGEVHVSDQNMGAHQTVCHVPHLAVFNFKGGGEGVVRRVCSVAQGHRLCKASARTRWVSASLATSSLPPHWQPTSCVELDSKRGTTMPL